MNRNVAADGQKDALIDFQGVLPQIVHVGISFDYKALGYEHWSDAGQKVAVEAFSQTITVPADKTEDGQSRDITLSWDKREYTFSEFNY